MKTNIQSPIHSRLESARTELLDLGLRNPLLNYRTLRGRGLEIIDEIAAQVFRLLVRDGKAMSFLPAQEDKASDLLSQPEEDMEGDLAARHTDLRLQTALSSAQLQSRLLATYYAARTFIEEQGVNILFIALGMLKWYEADNSQTELRAPLLLIPVELERSNARERFRVRYTEEEVGENLSLAAKLKERGITLPALPEIEDLDVPSYFDSIATAVRSQSRWSIDKNSIGLGFFSFNKFLMYRDLDVTRWPEESSPLGHTVVEALLGEGFRESDFQIADEDHLDKHIAPNELSQVMDADSSQTLAILAAGKNHNLVIQGPPGTGKSQTITNIIAVAIAQGKTVLFASEKMAALEVVKRRLDKIGLGDACLEFHSHKTQKKAVLNELSRTLYLGKPKVTEINTELSLLVQGRDRLNEYCEAVNTPIKESGITPYQAFGDLILLKRKYGQEGLPKINAASMLFWSGPEFKRREALVEELQAHLAVIGIPQDHPFWGSRRKVFLPTEKDRLARELASAQKAVAGTQEASPRLARSLVLPATKTRSDTEMLCRAARRAIEAPELSGVRLRTADWQSRQEELRNLLRAGTTLARLHRLHDETLIPESWEQSVLDIRQALSVYGRKWWRIFSGEYRSARNKLTGLCRDGLPKGLDAQLALVDAIMEAQRQKKIFNQYESVGLNLFGAQWQGVKSDWPVLERLFEWIIQLYRDVGDRQLPEGILDFIAGSNSIARLAPELSEVENALNGHLKATREVVSLLELDETIRFGANAGFEDQDFIVQRDALARWLERLSDLQQLVTFNHFTEILIKEDLGEVLRVAGSWPLAGSHIVTAFRSSWYERLLEQAFSERDALARFDRSAHEHLVRRFCQLDTLLFEYNRSRLAHAHWEKMPQHQAGGQLGMLKREFEKKSRHLPIRQLMLKAGNAIQAIKPVFMMSPLSIATFLPPGSIDFDLVIFDEASQVKPVDALGAIFRGRQTIVVGDSKQLPPTSFFDSLTKGDDADEDNVTGDIESILGLFAAQGAPQKMLRWHYRSRHESLIAVSNKEFYDNRLVVFPSPDAGKQELGLIYNHHPHTIYDRGRTRTNKLEAQKVAEGVMKHARAQVMLPAEKRITLGVAAFSQAQMQAIQDQLELLRRQDSSGEEFFSGSSSEPFFVKNLETVQGDERDVMFISIGYGRTAEGYVAMEFGPLNRDGGERRLNVLITRARLRCEVFTNLAADDIDLNRTNSRGVRALKIFLSYAQSGRLDVPVLTGRDFDSPFEQGVFSELANLGYEVKQQIGSAGFFIDLAVVDPARPGRFILGIECDGATYHSARSARDRDRLRQEVLESLGWRIHRIWSTDWFRDPKRELERVVAAIEEAMLYAAAGDRISGSSKSAESTVIERNGKQILAPVESSSNEYMLSTLPADTGGLELHRVPTALLASWVIAVVKVESPVHFSEAVQRIANATGIRRVASRIQSAMELACDHAIRAGHIRRQGDFLWLADLQIPTIRNRGNLPASARKINLIAPEEIELAIEKAVKDSYGLEQDSIPAAACRLLGLSRLSSDTKEQVEMVVRRMIESGKLTRQGNHLIA